MPSSSIPVPGRDSGSSPSSRKTNMEDLRRQNSKLKADLEAERTKHRQLVRDKALETKRTQEVVEKEKQKAIELVTKRLTSEHSLELRKIRENVAKEKENELRQVLKFKDEEVKALKQQVSEEKEKNRAAEEEVRRLLVNKSKEGEDHSETERKLRSEIAVLKEQKQRAEEMYRLKASAETEQMELVRRMKIEHELELQKFIKDSKRETVQSLQQRRLTEKALEEKEHELVFKDQLARKLEAEKGDLQRRISLTGELEPLRRSSLRTSASFDTTVPDRLDDSPYSKKDRERELKKRNAELQGRMESLEKKCAMLEKENSKGGSVKATYIAEEKIKKLKKRNSELISIARQLEDKAKKLQEEKKLVEDANLNNNAGVEHVKRVYARQRAKDLAEHAKSLIMREKELEEVKRRLAQPQNSHHPGQSEKLEELQSIIRQSAKERLWLEKQISNSELSQSPSPQPLHGDLTTESRKKAETLSIIEAENKSLKESVIKLRKAEEESFKLAEELKAKQQQNQKLVNDLEGKQTRCSRLELERERFAAKCTMLQKKNGELGKRLTELEEVENEVVAVKEQLNVAEESNLALSKDCKKLKSQLDELLQVKQDLKSMEQQKERLEQDYLASVEKLKERQEEIRQLHKIQEEANNAHEMAVTSLEDTVRSLEQKCIDAEENNINLKKEMEELKEEERLWKRKRSDVCHKSTQTVVEPSSTKMSTSLHKEGRSVLDKEGSAISLEPSHVKRPTTAAYASPHKPLHEFMHVESSPTTQHKTAAESSPSQVGAKNTETLKKPVAVGAADVATKSDNILEDLSSRINELAASDSEDDSTSENLPDQQTNEKKKGKTFGRSELDLEALSRRINQVAGGDDTSTSSFSRERNDSDASQDLTSMADGDLGDLEDNQPDSSAPEDEQADHSEKPLGTLNSHHAEPTNNQKLPGATRSEPNVAEESLDNSYLEGDDSDVDPAIHEKLAVYIARYSYDPVQHSPNENPEAELAFQAGDYLYVFGEMDEDGYFTGELMNGKRGLVPSNFVEKVADESDLNRMLNGTAEGIDGVGESSDEEETDEDESGSEEGETELTVLGEDGERQLKPVRMLRFSGKLHRALRLSLEHIPDVALDDITEEEEDGEEGYEILSESEDNEDASKEALFAQDGLTSDTDLEPFRVPSPRRLVLERQFTRSVLLSWKPAELPADQIKGYSVYVNGELRLMIKGASKTKALLEDIDADETYRISVRTITTEGEESSDRSAVVNIGRDASLAPSHVQVTCVSPTSAKIEWEPGNSSFSHEIIVNGALHRTVRPGTFQHTLTSLEPDHAYKVHVRATNPKRALDYDDEADVEVDSLTAGAEFRTEPGGLPDPPLDVEVVERDSNALEVNWIPITITEKGTSNGARVTGYRVYINSFPCTEVTSPTADCVTVVSWMIERAVKRSRSDVLRLVVRTQSCEGESTDSNEVELPVKMFNFKADQLVKPKVADLPLKSTVSTAETNLYEVSNEVDGVPEQTDSVRRFSRNESGQPKPVTVGEAERAAESNPLTQPRTKGKPVVWKYDAAEDSECDAEEETEIADCSTNSEESSASEDEDDERLEVWIPDVLEGTEGAEEKASGVNTNEYQQLEKEDEKEADVPEAEQRVDERNEDYEEGEEMEEEGKLKERTFVGAEIPDKPQTKRKDSDLSVVSDIDMEELGRSLDEAEAIPRRGPSNREDEDKKPYIRPLDYEESDFEDESSEQEPLSIIQEEDEEDLTESQALMSRVSLSHSASEGFQSDDDVMDLLDEDHDRQQSSAHSVNVGSVRRISQNDGPPTWNVEPPEGEISDGNALGFGKYLATSQEESKSDISVESQDRLLDNIELEECEGEGVGSEGRDATYSDTEADHGEVERVSSPYGDHEGANLNPTDAYPGVDQGVAHMGKGHGEVMFVAEEQFPNNQQEVNNDPDPEYQVRVFLALYDYDPAIMSPNPDAEEEELAFTEGDLIKVYGDKDEDGFYWGELDGRAGFIPYNMVSEIRLEDEESGSVVISPSLDLNQDSTQSLNQSLQSEVSGTDPDDATGDITLEDDEYEDPRCSANYQLPPRRMVAQFDYDPQTLSPNPDSEVELRFRVGDVILVYGEMDADGFYTGDLRGVRGLVPSNFLQDLSEPPEPVYQDSSHESSLVSNSSDEKFNTPNGTHLVTEDTSRKKKGIFSKGKQMFKKIAKSHNSPKSSGSKR